MRPETCNMAAKNNERLNSTAFITYTQTTYGRINRLLNKYIKSVALPPRKIYSYLPHVKDALELRKSCVYSIPCECDQVCIGQSGRSIRVRIKEHNRHIRIAQTEKSAVVEQSNNQDNIIKLKDRKIHSTKPRYMEDTGCSAKSANKIQTPGNHLKERIRHSEHGDSLKSRINIGLLTVTHISMSHM